MKPLCIRIIKIVTISTFFISNLSYAQPYSANNSTLRAMSTVNSPVTFDAEKSASSGQGIEETTVDAVALEVIGVHGNQVRVIPAEDGKPRKAMLAAKEGGHKLIYTKDNMVYILDRDNKLVKVEADFIGNVFFSNNGTYVYFIAPLQGRGGPSGGYSVRIFELAKPNEPILEWKKVDHYIHTPSLRYLLFYAAPDTIERVVIDVPSRRMTFPADNALASMFQGALHAASSNDNRLIVCLPQDSTFFMCDTKNMTLRKLFETEDSLIIHSTKVSPDFQRLGICYEIDGSLRFRLYDLSQAIEAVVTIDEPIDKIPDRIEFGENGTEVRLIDVDDQPAPFASGETPQKGSSAGRYRVEADQSSLHAKGYCDTVLVHDTRHPEGPAIVTARRVSQYNLSPGGRYIIFVYYDSKADVYDLDNPRKPLLKGLHAGLSHQFSPGDKYLMLKRKFGYAPDDRTVPSAEIIFFDLATGKQHSTTFTDRFMAEGFSRSGRYFAYTSAIEHAEDRTILCDLWTKKKIGFERDKPSYPWQFGANEKGECFLITDTRFETDTETDKVYQIVRIRALNLRDRKETIHDNCAGPQERRIYSVSEDGTKVAIIRRNLRGREEMTVTYDAMEAGSRDFDPGPVPKAGLPAPKSSSSGNRFQVYVSPGTRTRYYQVRVHDVMRGGAVVLTVEDVEDFRMSPNGWFILFTDKEGKATVYDLRKRHSSIIHKEDASRGFSFAPGSKHIMLKQDIGEVFTLSGGKVVADTTLAFFDLETGRRLLRTPSGKFTAEGFSHTGRYFAYSDAAEEPGYGTSVYDLETEEIILLEADRLFGAWRFGSSADGECIIAADVTEEEPEQIINIVAYNLSTRERTIRESFRRPIGEEPYRLSDNNTRVAIIRLAGTPRTDLVITQNALTGASEQFAPAPPLVEDRDRAPKTASAGGYWFNNVLFNARSGGHHLVEVHRGLKTSPKADTFIFAAYNVKECKTGPGGQRILFLDYDGRATVYDPKNPGSPIIENKDASLGYLFGPNGKRIMLRRAPQRSFNGETTIAFYDLKTGKLLREITDHFTAIGFRNAGRQFIYLGESVGRVMVYDFETNRLQPKFALEPLVIAPGNGHPAISQLPEITASAEKASSGGNAGKIPALSADAAVPEAILEALASANIQRKDIEGMAVVQELRRTIITTRARRLFVFNEEAEPIHQAVAFKEAFLSRDRDFLVYTHEFTSGPDRAAIGLCNLATGELEHSVNCHSYLVSPGRGYILYYQEFRARAVGGEDQTSSMRLFNVGSPVTESPDMRPKVSLAAAQSMKTPLSPKATIPLFTSDERYLIYKDEEGALWRYDIAAERSQAILAERQHGNTINWMALNPDGCYLLVSVADDPCSDENSLFIYNITGTAITAKRLSDMGTISNVMFETSTAVVLHCEKDLSKSILTVNLEAGTFSEKASSGGDIIDLPDEFDLNRRFATGSEPLTVRIDGVEYLLRYKDGVLAVTRLDGNGGTDSPIMTKLCAIHYINENGTVTLEKTKGSPLETYDITTGLLASAKTASSGEVINLPDGFNSERRFANGQRSLRVKIEGIEYLLEYTDGTLTVKEMLSSGSRVRSRVMSQPCIRHEINQDGTVALWTKGVGYPTTYVIKTGQEVPDAEPRKPASMAALLGVTEYGYGHEGTISNDAIRRLNVSRGYIGKVIEGPSGHKAVLEKSGLVHLTRPDGIRMLTIGGIEKFFFSKNGKHLIVIRQKGQITEVTGVYVGYVSLDAPASKPVYKPYNTCLVTPNFRYIITLTAAAQSTGTQRIGITECDNPQETRFLRVARDINGEAVKIFSSRILAASQDDGQVIFFSSPELYRFDVERREFAVVVGHSDSRTTIIDAKPSPNSRYFALVHRKKDGFVKVGVYDAAGVELNIEAPALEARYKDMVPIVGFDANSTHMEFIFPEEGRRRSFSLFQGRGVMSSEPRFTPKAALPRIGDNPHIYSLRESMAGHVAVRFREDPALLYIVLPGVEGAFWDWIGTVSEADTGLFADPIRCADFDFTTDGGAIITEEIGREGRYRLKTTRQLSPMLSKAASSGFLFELSHKRPLLQAGTHMLSGYTALRYHDDQKTLHILSPDGSLMMEKECEDYTFSPEGLSITLTMSDATTQTYIFSGNTAFPITESTTSPGNGTEVSHTPDPAKAASAGGYILASEETPSEEVFRQFITDAEKIIYAGNVKTLFKPTTLIWAKDIARGGGRKIKMYRPGAFSRGKRAFYEALRQRADQDQPLTLLNPYILDDKKGLLSPEIAICRVHPQVCISQAYMDSLAQIYAGLTTDGLRETLIEVVAEAFPAAFNNTPAYRARILFRFIHESTTDRKKMNLSAAENKVLELSKYEGIRQELVKTLTGKVDTSQIDWYQVDLAQLRQRINAVNREFNDFEVGFLASAADGQTKQVLEIVPPGWDTKASLDEMEDLGFKNLRDIRQAGEQLGRSGLELKVFVEAAAERLKEYGHPATKENIILYGQARKNVKADQLELYRPALGAVKTGPVLLTQVAFSEILANVIKGKKCGIRIVNNIFNISTIDGAKQTSIEEVSLPVDIIVNGHSFARLLRAREMIYDTIGGRAPFLSREYIAARLTREQIEQAAGLFEGDGGFRIELIGENGEGLWPYADLATWYPGEEIKLEILPLSGGKGVKASPGGQDAPVAKSSSTFERRLRALQKTLANGAKTVLSRNRQHLVIIKEIPPTDKGQEYLVKIVAIGAPEPLAQPLFTQSCSRYLITPNNRYMLLLEIQIPDGGSQKMFVHMVDLDNPAKARKLEYGVDISTDIINAFTGQLKVSPDDSSFIFTNMWQGHTRLYMCDLRSGELITLLEEDKPLTINATGIDETSSYIAACVDDARADDRLIVWDITGAPKIIYDKRDIGHPSWVRFLSDTKLSAGAEDAGASYQFRTEDAPGVRKTSSSGEPFELDIEDVGFSVSRELVGNSEESAQALAQRISGVLQKIGEAPKAADTSLNPDLEKLQTAVKAAERIILHTRAYDDDEVVSLPLRTGKEGIEIAIDIERPHISLEQFDDNDFGFLIINALLRKCALNWFMIWIKARITVDLPSKALYDHIFGAKAAIGPQRVQAIAFGPGQGSAALEAFRRATGRVVPGEGSPSADAERAFRQALANTPPSRADSVEVLRVPTTRSLPDEAPIIALVHRNREITFVVEVTVPDRSVPAFLRLNDGYQRVFFAELSAGIFADPQVRAFLSTSRSGPAGPLAAAVGGDSTAQAIASVQQMFESAGMLLPSAAEAGRSRITRIEEGSTGEGDPILMIHTTVQQGAIRAIVFRNGTILYGSMSGSGFRPSGDEWQLTLSSVLEREIFADRRVRQFLGISEPGPAGPLAVAVGPQEESAAQAIQGLVEAVGRRGVPLSSLPIRGAGLISSVDKRKSTGGNFILLIHTTLEQGTVRAIVFESGQIIYGTMAGTDFTSLSGERKQRLPALLEEQILADPRVRHFLGEGTPDGPKTASSGGRDEPVRSFEELLRGLNAERPPFIGRVFSATSSLPEVMVQPLGPGDFNDNTDAAILSSA